MDSNNYFTDNLDRFFAGKGRKISSSVLGILSRSIGELNESELDTYHRVIVPSLPLIIKTLKEMARQPGTDLDEWRHQLLFYGHTIIGGLVLKVLEEVEKEAVLANDQHGFSIDKEYPQEQKSRKIPMSSANEPVAKRVPSWTRKIGIAALALIVATGTLGAYLYMRRNKAAMPATGTASALNVLFLRDGDVHHGAVVEGRYEYEGKILDDFLPITGLDLSQDGKRAVYSCLHPVEIEVLGGGYQAVFYIYRLDEGMVTAYSVDSNLHPSGFVMDSNNRVWLNASSLGPGVRFFCYDLTTGLFKDVDYGALIDINESLDRSILVRREYHPEGGAYHVFVLADSHGSVIREISNTYGDRARVPHGFSQKGGYIVYSDSKFENGAHVHEKLGIMDMELIVKQEIILEKPVEKINSVLWDEENGSVLFAVENDGIYLIDLKESTSPKKLEEGEVYLLGITDFSEIKAFQRERPSLSEKDRDEILNKVETWYTPELNLARRGSMDFDFAQLWYLLAENSPIKREYRDPEVDEKHAQMSFETIFAEMSLPLAKYEVRSIEYDGRIVYVETLCHYEDTVSPLYDEPIDPLQRDYFIFISEKGEWKIYDVRNLNELESSRAFTV